MKFIKSNQKRSGFILYEAVIALMIAIMTLGILQQALQIMKSIQNTSYKDQLTWHITNERLQDKFEHMKIRVCDKDKVIFHQEKLTKKIYVDESNHHKVLKIAVADINQEETVMTNLKQIKIEKIQNLVIITTVNNANEMSELYLTNDD